MSEYIEREAAIELIKKERNYTGKFSFEEEHAWAVGFQQGITFALSDIATIPAADVRPVVRGRWELKEGIMYCSECNKSPHYVYIPVDEWNFCPNCGAWMEES